MKNMKKLLIVVCLLFLATGCGGKKLTCTDSNDAGEETIVFSFDGNDNVESAIFTNVQEQDDSVDDDEINEMIAGEKKEAKKEGYEIDVKKDKNKLTFQAKINGKDKVEDFLQKSLGDYDTIKSSFKEEGFTCK